MSFKLDWTLFRRLIQLELLGLSLLVPLFLAEQLIYQDVGSSIDAMVADYGFDDALEIVAVPMAFLILGPVIVSLLAIDEAKAAGRTLHMVSGGLLRLAYSRDHGAIWFSSTEDQS